MTAEIPLSLVSLRHPPVATTLDTPAALLTDVDNMKTPVMLEKCVVARMATKLIEKSRTLAQKQELYMRYFHTKFGCQPVFTVCQTLYIIRPQLLTLSANRTTFAKYNRRCCARW